MCAEGERLLGIWNDAVEALNNVVEERFKMVSAGDHEGFRRTCVAVERAQCEVEVTRVALNSHRASHGCGKSFLPPVWMSSLE
jgi:hypothetical protein